MFNQRHRRATCKLQCLQILEIYEMPTASFPDSMMSLALSPASCSNHSKNKHAATRILLKSFPLVLVNLFPITLSVNGQHVPNYPPIQPDVRTAATSTDYYMQPLSLSIQSCDCCTSCAPSVAKGRRHQTLHRSTIPSCNPHPNRKATISDMQITRRVLGCS